MVKYQVTFLPLTIILKRLLFNTVKERRIPPSPSGSTATGTFLEQVALGTEIPKKYMYHYDGRWAPWMISNMNLTAEGVLVYSIVYASFWECEAWLILNYTKIEKLTGVPAVRARALVARMVQNNHLLTIKHRGEVAYIPNYEFIPENKQWIGYRLREFMKENNQEVRKML